MSNTVQRASTISNLEGLKRAVKRIPGAEYKGVGTVEQYSKSVSGHLVSLPGYKYDIAVDLETGDINADTYKGRWGDPQLQDVLAQGYAVECGKMDAEEKNRKFEEILQQDGSIKCVTTVGGSAPTLGENQDTIGGTSAPSL